MSYTHLLRRCSKQKYLYLEKSRSMYGADTHGTPEGDDTGA